MTRTNVGFVVGIGLLANACNTGTLPIETADASSDAAPLDGSNANDGSSANDASNAVDSSTGMDAAISVDASISVDAAMSLDSGISTAAVECNYSYSAFNSSASVNATSTSMWSCTSTLRSITANGIPDHPVGTFPNANNPNTITAQSVSATMPLVPENTGTVNPIQVVGYAFNGVKFDPETAGTCTVNGNSTTCSLVSNSGTWTIEALGQSSFNFGVDTNNAHVQPGGAYHYHGVPEGILTKMNKGMSPTLIGYALDGFPVYARYGYTSAMDATSAVKVMTSSYQTKTTPDSGRPSTATYPMGAFTQDYEYVSGFGDLDECNGRTDVTPEFPNGIYHYYVTDTYPFIQRCVKGTAINSGNEPGMDGGMMMMMMGPPDGGPPPMLDGGPPDAH